MATVARPRSSEAWIARSSKNLCFFRGKHVDPFDRIQIYTNWRCLQVLTSEKRACYKASNVKMIKSTNTGIPAQPFDIIKLCQLSHSQKINMEDSQDVIRCSTWLVAFKAVPCWATAARILPMRVRGRGTERFLGVKHLGFMVGMRTLPGGCKPTYNRGHHPVGLDYQRALIASEIFPHVAAEVFHQMHMQLLPDARLAVLCGWGLLYPPLV